MASPEISSPDRKALLDLCMQAIKDRITGYASELESLDEAAAAESRSSAGDKYETGREMIAQSRILIDHNLAESKANLAALDRMADAEPGAKIGIGTLVETTLGWYLVGVSLGEWESQGLVVRTVSLASPIGLALKGREAGDKVPWRGASFDILRIIR